MKSYKTLKQLAEYNGISEITAKRWKKKGKVVKGTRKVEIEEKCYYLAN